MASSLFGNQNPTPQNNSMIGMLQQFNQFKQQFGNQNPQSAVENLLKTGKMSQSQYQQFKEMAKQFSQFLR